MRHRHAHPATLIAIALLTAWQIACTPKTSPVAGGQGGQGGTDGAPSSGGSGSVAGSGGTGGGMNGGGAAVAGGSDGGTGGTGGTGGNGGSSSSAGGGGSAGGTGGAGGIAGGDGPAGRPDTGGDAFEVGGPMASSLCVAGDCQALVGSFDGFLYDHPCSDGGRGFDCAGPMCTGGASTRTQKFTIKGDAARVYEVTFKVRGIVESKNYSGGQRRAMSMDAGSGGGDQWYEGGTSPPSTYNSYELHVTPKVAGAPNDYFLNSRDGSTENHTSWALNYSAVIKVPGGGTISFRAFDSNCRHIMNCGPGVGSTSTVCKPRTLDLAGAVPSAPAGFVQPPRNAQGATGQWLFIDVNEVRAL